MKSKLIVSRFNMIEIALALVILAIGLSSVLVLFPIGLNAGKSSVADNNLANVAEQVMAYLQSELTVPANWNEQGGSANSSIGEFEVEPTDSAIPKAEDFEGDDSSATSTGMDGLLKKVDQANAKTYYLYRQYSGSGADRVMDFEAMIRVGLDQNSMSEQYYLDLKDGCVKKLSSTYDDDSEHPRMQKSGPITNLLPKFYKTVIVEFSWPADADWSKREKRIFRMELFNENFVPYSSAP